MSHINKRTKQFVTTLIAIIVNLIMTAPSAVANENDANHIFLQVVYQDPEAQVAFVRAKIVEYFPDTYATMLAIAYCETESRPYIHWEADGSLRGHDAGLSSASGTLQVLIGYHADAIREMGLDMNNIDDYMTFARRLHDESRNYSPWAETRDCWEPRLTSN